MRKSCVLSNASEVSALKYTQPFLPSKMTHTESSSLDQNRALKPSVTVTTLKIEMRLTKILDTKMKTHKILQRGAFRA